MKLQWLRVVVVDLGFTTLLTSQVISVTFYSEHEKSDKFCSEAVILAWGSLTCRKSMTQDPQLYCPSEGSHTQDFYTLKKSIHPGRVWTHEPRIQWRVWEPWDHRGWHDDLEKLILNMDYSSKDEGREKCKFCFRRMVT